MPFSSGVVRGNFELLTGFSYVYAIAEFIVANKINYVPARTDVETQNPILDLSKINVITTDVTWKGDNRKRFTQRWINEVIR